MSRVGSSPTSGIDEIESPVGEVPAKHAGISVTFIEGPKGTDRSATDLHIVTLWYHGEKTIGDIRWT